MTRRKWIWAAATAVISGLLTALLYAAIDSPHIWPAAIVTAATSTIGFLLGIRQRKRRSLTPELPSAPKEGDLIIHSFDSYIVGPSGAVGPEPEMPRSAPRWNPQRARRPRTEPESGYSHKGGDA